MTRAEGIALLLPGGARIKILAQGAQLAEYKEGRWNIFDSGEFLTKVGMLAENTGCGRTLLLNLLNKAFLASEQEKGRTFVLQGKDNVLSHCHSGYKSGADLSGELITKPITDIDDVHFLRLVEGDNAVVLSHDGKVLAINAALAPGPETIVQRLPGTGSRHLAAQKLTKEIDCIAVVVSDDRPVTIFFGGEVVVRRL
jgi:DNA integrity scanning protein DisA with diadenylate cyclase activity